MSTIMLVETAVNQLQDLLAQLPLGETVTLLNARGEPLALLVSLRTSSSPEAQTAKDWRAEWEDLAQKVSAAWKSEKSAIETLIEMRR